MSQRPPWRSRLDRRLPALSSLRGHEVSPQHQVTRGGEATHVGADLGNDGFGAELADAGVGAHDVDGDAKGREIGFDFAVQRAD